MPGPYRDPSEDERIELVELIGADDEGGPYLDEDKADELLDWLKKPEHKDVSVSAWWSDAGETDRLGEEGLTSILSLVYESRDIPVDHPIIAELDRRSPDFELKDGNNSWNTNVIKNLEKEIAFFKRNKMMENEPAKNIVAKLAHAKAVTNKPIIEAREAVDAVEGLKAVAEKRNLPEDVERHIGKFFIGKNTKEQVEATAKKPLVRGGRRTKKTIHRKTTTRRTTRNKSRRRAAQR